MHPHTDTHECKLIVLYLIIHILLLMELSQIGLFCNNAYEYTYIPQHRHMYAHLSNLSTLKSHTVAHTHTLQQRNSLDGTVDACSFYRLLFELKFFDFCQLERKLCDSIIIINVVGVRSEGGGMPTNERIYQNAETMQNKLHKHKYINSMFCIVSKSISILILFG